MKIYDEENFPYDDAEDDMSGYTVIDDHSIYKLLVSEDEPETIATPIPENEQTVILSEPSTARLHDGDELELQFAAENGCNVCLHGKKVGSLKPAYIKKLKTERGGQNVRVYYKSDVPPMIKLVFGAGAPVPVPDPENV